MTQAISAASAPISTSAPIGAASAQSQTQPASAPQLPAADAKAFAAVQAVVQQSGDVTDLDAIQAVSESNLPEEIKDQLYAMIHESGSTAQTQRALDAWEERDRKRREEEYLRQQREQFLVQPRDPSQQVAQANRVEPASEGEPVGSATSRDTSRSELVAGVYAAAALGTGATAAA